MTIFHTAPSVSMSSSESSHHVPLTISTFLEVVSKLPTDTESINSIPILITWLVADLCPLENDLGNHPRVHGGDAEPDDALLPAVTNSQQSNTECCLGQGLTHERAT